MKFLERRDPIEAVCWDGTNKEEIWKHWNYIKFAENLDGTVDGLVPEINGQTITLKIGDFLTYGPNGEAVPHKRNDFLYQYEEYTPEIPRVTVSCDITELNNKKPYLVEIMVPDIDSAERYLASAKENFDKLGIQVVMAPKFLALETTQLEKKGIYLVEAADFLAPEDFAVLKTELEKLGIKVVLTKKDSIKLKELEL